MAAGYLGTSQNGWPVYDDAHFQDHAVRTDVEGVGFWSANKDVAKVLDDFTQKYNDRIESITLPVKEYPGYDDWSRALRAIRGQTSGYSNHASCTARDLNSTRHPRGQHNTYSPAHRAALMDLVHDDLYRVDGGSILRDGEFYGPQSTIDGMHVEINDGVSAAEVKIVADRIRALEDDMPTPEDLWNADIIPVTETATAKVNKTWAASTAVGDVFDNVRRVRDDQRTMAGQLSTLTETVKTLTTAVEALAAKLP